MNKQGCSGPTMSGGADEADRVSPLPGLGGKRRRTKKWIQKVVAKMDKGAFTKSALRHGETPLEYAKDVLKHPKKHSLKTRRRAQFLKNISKTRKFVSSTRKTRSRK